MMTLVKQLLLYVLLVPCFSTFATEVAGQDKGSRLQYAINGEHRTDSFVSRDQYRHPRQTLEFFEVEADMSVVEIWPGQGWYTEILAPYLSRGVFYAAYFPAGVGVSFYDKYRRLFEEKLARNPDIYGAVKITDFDPKRAVLSVPDSSLDRVLTFRNVHNWLRTESEATAFELFYRALKPGGILGVVEHRAQAKTDWNTMKDSGYMTEQYVIELAESAGFVLEARSEMNANPKDNKRHPEGVWSLPPTLRGVTPGGYEARKFLAIGESDRMTLKFRKPDQNN